MQMKWEINDWDKKKRKRDLSKVNKYIGELRLQSNMWMNGNERAEKNVTKDKF